MTKQETIATLEAAAAALESEQQQASARIHHAVAAGSSEEINAARQRAAALPTLLFGARVKVLHAKIEAAQEHLDARKDEQPGLVQAAKAAEAQQIAATKALGIARRAIGGNETMQSIHRDAIRSYQNELTELTRDTVNTRR